MRKVVNRGHEDSYELDGVRMKLGKNISDQASNGKRLLSVGLVSLAVLYNSN